MTSDDATAAVRRAGHSGWKAVTRPHPDTADHVAALTSGDYDPVRRKGLLVMGMGATPKGALDDALGRIRPVTPEDGQTIATPEDGMATTTREG